jgi:prepilin-type N-terminal cleavage/methylation domain-containing protein
MNPISDPVDQSRERGMTLIEILIALVVLSVGILAVGRLFPSGTRAQVQDHLLTGANNYAQERIEDLSTHAWTDTALSVGRHPGGSAAEKIGQWQRFYNVSTLAAPLNNLKRIDVTVTYSGAGLQTQRSVVATTYMRQ